MCYSLVEVDNMEFNYIKDIEYAKNILETKNIDFEKKDDIELLKKIYNI